MIAATEKDLFTKMDRCLFGAVAQHNIGKHVAPLNPEEAAEDALRERFVRLGYQAGPAEKKELSEPTGPLLASNECMEVAAGRDAQRT
jgi:hypothetical protein